MHQRYLFWRMAFDPVEMPFAKMCNRRGCPEYTDGARAYCPAHWAEEAERQRARERSWIYRDKRWRRVRRVVLKRDEYTCVLCGANEVELGGQWNLVVDHAGGDYSDPFNPEKLRTLCRVCSGEQDGGRARAQTGVPAEHVGL